MTADWFHALTGFTETSYADTQANLEVVGNTLRSRVNGQSYQIGTLETPSLAELRARALAVAGPRSGRLQVSSVVGDVAALHRDAANHGALFQVASQFNLLEMSGPHVTPEDGVTRYAHDRTQGPACAVAAGAATIYRNYCLPVDGEVGQTRLRQVDCLRDIGAVLGNHNNALWTMQNGYALCSESGLAAITHTLGAMANHERDALRDRLRVGLHWDVQVTGLARTDLRVSQAFCSALPVSYTSVPPARWQAFATLVLEGAYEATLWAAVLNAQRTGSPVVFLTHLGGGAFGNDRAWIDAARKCNAGRWDRSQFLPPSTPAGPVQIGRPRKKRAFLGRGPPLSLPSGLARAVKCGSGQEASAAAPEWAMYLITYGGRTVIHDGSVEGPHGAPLDLPGHEKQMKLSSGNVIHDGPDSERAHGLPPSPEVPRRHGRNVDV